MNIIGRAGAGAGLLLLALHISVSDAFYDLREALGIKPKPREHGAFRPIKLVPDTPAKQCMAGAGLLAAALACLVCLVVTHGAGIAHAMAYLTLAFGAAGTFSLKNQADKPLPQYTFLGVYTGGSSDTSPLDIPFASYNAAFASRCNGVAPIPYLYLVQTIGNVETMAVTCTATNLVLTFTTSGSGLSSFVATLGATIPNTVTQP